MARILSANWLYWSKLLSVLLVYWCHLRFQHFHSLIPFPSRHCLCPTYFNWCSTVILINRTTIVKAFMFLNKSWFKLIIQLSALFAPQKNHVPGNVSGILTVFWSDPIATILTIRFRLWARQAPHFYSYTGT